MDSTTDRQKTDNIPTGIATYRLNWPRVRYIENLTYLNAAALNTSWKHDGEVVLDFYYLICA